MKAGLLLQMLGGVAARAARRADFRDLRRILQFLLGGGSKIGTQNGTLANGNMD